MSKQYPSTNITLASIEDKGLTLKIKDSEGRSWVLWKNAYQSNEPSEAYTSILSHKLGDTFGVTYSEKPDEYQGKSYIKRTIFDVLPPVANPSNLSTVPPKSFSSGANNASSEPSKDDKFWEMKAYKQCLWNYWLEKVELKILLEQKDMDLVWDVFQNIEKDANKRFFQFSKESKELDLPVIDINEPLPTESGSISVEDIPF